MRVVIAKWPIRDSDGTEWILKLLGPEDRAPRGELVSRIEGRIEVMLETPNDPDHEWYGADPLRFPVAGLSVALTPLFERIMTEART